jgi:hypothetical protein
MAAEVTLKEIVAYSETMKPMTHEEMIWANFCAAILRQWRIDGRPYIREKWLDCLLTLFPPDVKARIIKENKDALLKKWKDRRKAVLS